MQASIHSRDDVNSLSSGKTFRVSSNTIAVRCTDGVLTVSADEVEHSGGSSERFPNAVSMRDVTRTFSLELSPREVKRIVDAAIRNHLLHVRAEFAVVEKRSKTRRAKG
jgi:HSP20 family molecular chaperone IbpA